MPSVLVIDDERDIRDSIRQVLGRAGFSVVTADNGATGVESYLENPADVSSLTSSCRDQTASR